jgi:NAD(P) transhydrogenase subunit alpha
VVERHGVRIVGHANVPSRVAVDASQLYARNLLSFVALIVQKDGTLKIDREDDIVKGSLLTIDGHVVHPNFAPTPPAPAAAASPTTL